ncbi:MAG: hypothetical protein HQM15_07375 [Deltaproteobacteria bacterium]|nr:hypothetical protein [Deltaproteobacteria bacterium]
MLQVDQRKDLRINSIKAQVGLSEDRVYDVSNISQDALLAANPSGFDPEMVQKLSAGPFEFELIDPTSNSSLSLLGEIIRYVEEGGVTDGIVIGFKFLE